MQSGHHPGLCKPIMCKVVLYTPRHIAAKTRIAHVMIHSRSAPDSDRRLPRAVLLVSPLETGGILRQIVDEQLGSHWGLLPRQQHCGSRIRYVLVFLLLIWLFPK